MQSDGVSENIMNVSTRYSAMIAALGFNVIDVDGHNVNELSSAFASAKKSEKPVVIMANTIKGKGVSFMENSPDWHHNRLTQTLYEQAIKELDGVA